MQDKKAGDGQLCGHAAQGSSGTQFRAVRAAKKLESSDISLVESVESAPASSIECLSNGQVASRISQHLSDVLFPRISPAKLA